MRPAHSALLATLLGSILAASCSPPPPKPTEPTAPPADTVEPTGPDLSPVPVPSGVVAKLRAKDLGATLRVGGTMIGAPSGADNAATLILSELIAGKRGLRLDVSGGELAAQVALDAPVDVVVALDPERSGVHFAFALGLKSLDAARTAAGSSLVEAGPGVWAIGGEKARASCAIMQAAGAVPGRLVCGGRDADLSALGPYLARTAPTEAPAAQDLVLDIDVAAVNARFGDELKKVLPAVPNIAKRRYGIGNETYDKGFEGGARFLSEELGLLLADVKGVHVDAGLSETTGIDLKLRVDFASATKSWLAKSLLATPSLSVPQLLWDGPGDSDSAWFGSSGDPSGYGELVKAAKALIVGALEKDKVGTDAERKKLAALLDLPIVKGTTVVAYGGTQRLTPAPKPKSSKEKWQSAFDQLTGWYIFGVGQKSEPWAKWLKDGVAAFNQPGIQKSVKAVLGGTETLALKSVAAPKQLGKGSFAVELAFSSKLDKTEGTLHLLLLPDGESTWIGIGFDRDELVERLTRAKDGKASLKDRADLSPLRQGAVSSAGFMTLRSFRSSAFSLLLMRKPEQAQAPEDAMLASLAEADKLFDGLPGKGRAPSYMRASGTATSVSIDLTLGKAVFDDVRALVKSFQR